MRRTLGIGVLALAALLAPVASGGPLDRLVETAHAHPEDPDLAWALVRELTVRGRSEEALARLDAFVTRWPGRRADAGTWRGRLLFELDREAEAIEVLNAELKRRPEDGLAWFYRGLARRRLGFAADASRDLEKAATLEPSLETETLVLRGIDRLAAGDEAGGRTLLDRATEREPGSPVVKQAREALPDTDPGGPARWTLWAQGGVEFDSNVTLDSGLDLPGTLEDSDDLRLVWGTGAAWTPIEGRRGRVSIGYRYDESAHDDIGSYDQQSHGVFASGLLRAGERGALRLDGRFSTVALDGQRYLHAASFEPSFFWALGGGDGLLRTFLGYERRDYLEDPILESLDRDAEIFGGGIEHTLLLGTNGDRWLTTGGSFHRTVTRGERDLFGLADAFDHDRWRLSSRLRWPLPWQLETLSSLAIAHEHYAHRNVIDLLTDDGVGTLSPRKRRDWIYEVGLGIGRPIHDSVRLELAWRGQRRRSDVDLYDTWRQVVGMYVRATMQ